MTFQSKLSAYSKLTDEALESIMRLEGMPQLLRESMSYSLFAGGKRLRPALVLAACELFGGDTNAAMPFACALEMIHCYSLIHDDLPAMDDDDMRRGKPSNHKVFGEGHAVLAGDGLQAYAFQILLQTIQHKCEPNLAEAAACIAVAAGVQGMVAGQCLDLQYESTPHPNRDLLYAIHHGKTAALLTAAVESGALCANADACDIDAMRLFGQQYGLLFQITDDILDVTGNEQTLGKTTGKDAKTGKITFPAVVGLEASSEFALQAAEQAKKALAPFGERAAFFQDLLEYTLQRKN